MSSSSPAGRRGFAHSERAQEPKAWTPSPGGPEALPEDSSRYAGRAAVVLDDLSALDITEAQQTSLQEYVAGGRGPPRRREARTPWAAASTTRLPSRTCCPFRPTIRQRLLFTRAKLLFVIDHSGSMSEKVGGETKQMIAMRGVAASIGDLNPLDEVGILGFDSSATWVLPFTPASDRKRILAALSSLGEGGGPTSRPRWRRPSRASANPGPDEAPRHRADGRTHARRRFPRSLLEVRRPRA